MYYFLGMILIALFIGANMRYGKRNVIKSKKNILTFERIVLLILFGICVAIFTFESTYSNSDMELYRDAHNSLQFLTNDNYLTNILDKKDPFFHLLSFYFGQLGFGFYAWHALIGLVYSYAIYVLLKKYSSNVYISFIVFVVLGQLGFALSALRQMLAIAFVIFAFINIETRKPIRFILLTIIASLFHSTAIIFLIAYPLYRIKLKVKTLILMTIGMLFIIPMAKPLFLFVLPRIGANEFYYEYLKSDEILSMSGAIISVCVFLFCVVALLKNKNSSSYQGLCNLAIVSIFFKILSASFFAEAFRLSLYFSVFDIILIAEACSCGEKNDKTLIRIKTLVVTVLLVIYYFISPHQNVLNYTLVF